MSITWREDLPRIAEVDFLMYYLIFMHFIEAQQGYDVQELMDLLDKAENTIRNHLNRLGKEHLIEKRKPFGSLREIFIPNQAIILELKNLDFNFVQLGVYLRKLLTLSVRCLKNAFDKSSTKI